MKLSEKAKDFIADAKGLEDRNEKLQSTVDSLNTSVDIFLKQLATARAERDEAVGLLNRVLSETRSAGGSLFCDGPHTRRDGCIFENIKTFLANLKESDA